MLRVNAWNRPAALTSGAWNPPASRARSTSRGATSASASMSAWLSTRSPSRPPLTMRFGLLLAKSRSAFAAMTASPETKAIATGPSSSGTISARPVSCARGAASVFLKTLYSVRRDGTRPQRRELGHRQPAVLGEHGGVGGVELRPDLVDHRALAAHLIAAGVGLRRHRAPRSSRLLSSTRWPAHARPRGTRLVRRAGAHYLTEIRPKVCGDGNFEGQIALAAEATPAGRDVHWHGRAPTSVSSSRAAPTCDYRATLTSGLILTPGPIVDDVGDRPDVLALRRRGLGPQDLVVHGLVVGVQRVDVEARLADRHVHVAVTVGAVLDLAALELGRRPCRRRW